MVQIIDDPNRTTASQWSNSISQALDRFAQSKLQSMQQQQQLQAFVQAGFPPQMANLLTQLSPQERTAFFQRINPGDFSSQQNSQPNLDNSLQQLSSDQGLETSQPQQPQMTQEPYKGKIPPLNGQEAVMRALEEYQNKQAVEETPIRPTSPQNNPNTAPQEQQKRPATVADILARPSPRDEREERRHQETINKQDELARRKHADKYIETALDREDANDKDLSVLERIIHLRDSDKIQTGLAQFFKLAGFDITALKNANTNEMEKLTNWFLRGGTKLFGGKVSNQEMMAIINSVPNALQNKEASKQLANQMITQKRWENEEAKVIRKLRKQYGKNGPPWDFRDIVRENMEDTNRRYHEAFVQGIPVDSVGKGHASEDLQASKYRGKRRRNLTTGQIEKSNGTEWIPE